MAKVSPKGALLAECRGDLAAAQLLDQVRYWTPRAKVRRAGQSWAVKTRAEWCRETGLTLKQYKRAVRVLQDLRLIETRVVRWSRSTAAGLRAVKCSQEFPVGANAMVPIGANAYTESSCPERLDAYASNSAGARKKPTGDQPMPSPGKPSAMSSLKGKSLEEVLALAKAKKPSKPATSPEAIWREIYLTLDLPYLHPWDIKRQSQGKMLLKKLGDNAKAKLALLMTEWSDLTTHIKTQAGLFKAPAVPDVGFLLLHVAHAHSWLHGLDNPGMALGGLPSAAAGHSTGHPAPAGGSPTKLIYPKGYKP